MAGRWTAITWQGRRARAWIPDELGSGLPDLSDRTVRACERAAAAVRRADERMPSTWEPIARILLRTEGVASSDVEGLRAPIDAVAVAEVDDELAGTDAAWVADNLAVVHDAIATAGARLTNRLLHGWHRRLMAHSGLPAPFVGRFRNAQGWIGGASPVDAVFVPPPPEAIPGLMRDLVAFASRRGVDPIVQAAVVHAQFETIHPYGDGNGRLGRVLISWALARRLETTLPPPVSVLIARDPGGYLSGLHEFREGDADRYVRWFADVVARAGDASVVLADRIRALLAEWQARVSDLRADSAARQVEVLAEHPVLHGGVLAARLGISERAARNAIDALASRGILDPFDVPAPASARGRPRRWWIATDLLDLVGEWAG